MSSTVVRYVLLCTFLAGVVAPIARADSAPTASDVRAIREKLQKERAEALAARFPEDTLVRADDLAARGEKALKAENYAAAARYFRDARWQIPYLPPGLPDHVVRVFGESRLRHADRVNRLAYNAAGTRLASCSRDGTVKVWDLGNGREVATYRGHIDQPDDPTKVNINKLGVSGVAFHPKQPLIASASGNQVHLWNPETGKYVKTLLNLGKTEKPIKPIAFSPDGKQLAVGADDGILRVVETDTGKVIYSSPARNARIESLAYSPNGKMIVVGDNNSQIIIYSSDPKAEQPLMTAPGLDQGEVRDVMFSADSGAVFAAGRDAKVRLTAGPKPDGTAASTTATRLRDFAGHSDPVNALGLTPDGVFLITGGKDNTVRVWEVASAKQLRGFQLHPAKEGVIAIAVRGDGKQIASGSDDGGMRLWDLNPVDEHRAFTEAEGSLWATAYSPDGKRLAAAGSDKSIRVYNPETGKLEATLPGARSPITSLAFFPDSNRLAAAGGDREVVLWDVARAKPIQTLRGHESAILSLAVSDDGKRVASGAADRTLRVYSPESEQALITWTGRSAICAVAIYRTGKLVAAGMADGTLVLLDVSGPSAKEVYTHPAHVSGVACLAYSPNGQRLASVGGDGVLRIWNVGDDGIPTPSAVKLEVPNRSSPSGTPFPLTGVAFARDNRYVATVGADHAVHIWDVESKMESRSLLGHTDWVTAVSFSPDGRAVASVGVDKDKALRMFELPPLDPAAGGGHLLGVNAVAVSASGRQVATAGIDQTIRLWDIASGKEVGTLVGNADTPFTITFLGNDELVMGGSLPTRDTGRLHFWRTNPGQELKAVPTGEVFTVVATVDGSRLGVWASRAAVGDQVKNITYELYDAKGNLLSSIPDRGRKVQAVTFSPDLEWAVAGDDKGNVAIWDLVGKKQIGSDWPLFANPFLDIGITPDKKYLIAADDHGKVVVADVAKRNVLTSFSPHTGGVRTILVSPAGKSFLTVSNDSEVKSWTLDPVGPKEPKATRTWSMPVGVNGVCFTPDGKQVVTANADGTAYLLELP